MKATVRKGFTLIEILIVVIILGILAAIVIPQFTSASDDAKLSSIRSTVQSVRGQIELFKLQHNDQYPTDDMLVNGDFSWPLLTQYSTITGDQGYLTKAEAQTAADLLDGKVYGPYMQEIPANPFTGINAVGAAAAVDVGWVFDADGRFWGVDKSGTGLVTMQNVKGASGSN